MTTQTDYALLPPQSADAEALRARFPARFRAAPRFRAEPVSRALIVSRGIAAPGPTLLATLQARSFRATAVRTDDGSELPAPEGLEAAVLIGQASYAEATAGVGFERELDWIRHAHSAGVRILGLGHGARALAAALGGDVIAAPRANRGWTLLDTVAPQVIPAGPWVAWQHDVIVPPDDSVVIASNNFGPQALRIGPHLAIQFHPEATVESVSTWLALAGEPTDVDGVFRGVGRDPAAAEVSARTLFAQFLDARAPAPVLAPV